MAKKEKPNQAVDLKKQTLLDLQKKLAVAQKECFKLKLELKMGKLKNVKEPRQKRKEIARIQTIIQQKKMEQK